MKVSEKIKSYGLPGTKYVYEQVGVSRDVFYGWSRRFPRVVDLICKGLIKEREDGE